MLLPLLKLIFLNISVSVNLATPSLILKFPIFLGSAHGFDSLLIINHAKTLSQCD